MIEPGETLLNYRLVEKLGEGGMGVVWKAVDTTLERQVAIKVLPDSFTGEPERLMRFEREARLLAALNHPGIATIHGLHRASTDSGELHFLVMELAEGEDLSKRLARGPISIDESLRIGLQLAEALEAAHDNGVIHRDLKPANVQVDADAKAKVLDFGLAKAFEPDPSSAPDPSHSPTMTFGGTEVGVILGTAAYMSPEQAAGRPVDKRADVWAFGCVMLEMLTGRRTFHGDSVAETLAAVMKEPPQFELLPAQTPQKIRRLLRRCLMKDPRQRLRDLGDARIAIAEVLAGSDEELAGSTDDVAPAPPAWQRALPWALAALLAVTLAGTWLSGRDFAVQRPSVERSLRLSVVFPEGRPMFLSGVDLELLPAFAMSPTEERFVYQGLEREGPNLYSAANRRLYTRSLHDLENEMIRGTESAEQPFYSPDGRWIGFFTGSHLSKVPAGGGARVDIVEGIGGGTGASWGADGTIVFAHSFTGPLWRVPETGGEPRAVTSLHENETHHRYPQLLPDGKTVLFTVKLKDIVSFDDASLAVADLKTGEHRILLERGMHARYVDSGHLVYARDSALLAAPFDLDSLTITGGAVPVLEGVVTNPVTGTALFDVGVGGMLAYVPGRYWSSANLYAMDRGGTTRTELASNHYVSFPDLSPDGRTLIVHDSAAFDQVATIDIGRDGYSRLTGVTANHMLPFWHPDGKRVTMTVDRTGRKEIVNIPVDGGDVVSLVPPSDRWRRAHRWSADGKLLTINGGSSASRDIEIFDTRTGEVTTFLGTSHDEGDAVFSRDGKWIFFSSDESGMQEIYVSSYPGRGGKRQLSSGGGFQPHLRADGGELYYQTLTHIVAAPLTWDPAPRAGRAQPLFPVDGTLPCGFTVSADGQRFYVTEIDVAKWRSDRLDVVLNWYSDLSRVEAH